MYPQDSRLQALRKHYKRALLTNLGAVITAAVMTAILITTDTESVPPVSLAVTMLLSAALAGAEYIVERALLKRGINAALISIPCFIGTLVLGGLLMGASFLGLAGFLFFRPLIPLIALLRDRGRLTEGNPLETVGRIKAGSRRATLGIDTCLLFEDELTHEKHLLRAQDLSPRRRYRVLYLPHSGLAAGEIISDEMQFDPFGNPIESPPSTEAPTADPAPGFPESRQRHDPNSPERKQAAKLALWSRVCILLSYGLIGLTVLSAVIFKAADQSPPAFIFMVFPAAGLMILSNHLKHRGLKLRCTVRTTALCVDTVCRRSGKHSHDYPIVEFEVNGVPYTAELSTACSRKDVGQLYVIYYDPLDPSVVRSGWKE